MNKRPILFLDIDGVLNSAPFIKAHQWVNTRDMSHQIDPRAVEHLNTLHDLFPAMDWVLSSTWRFMHTPLAMTDILQAKGFRGRIHFATTKEDLSNRGEEIVHWLTNNDALDRPFVILDDNTDMIPVMDHLIQTTMAVGLLHEHTSAARDLLHKQGAKSRT